MGSAPAPEIKVKITGEDTGVSAAIKELGVQLQQLKRTQDDAASSARGLGSAEEGAGRSMREAREGAKLLSEETGVHLSRGLTGILAKSSMLGPLLNAAFPIAAAIGFGEVLASAAEKFSMLIANTFIYTEAMKQAYAAQVAVNADFVKRAEDNKKLAEEAALFGLKGSERDIADSKPDLQEHDFGKTKMDCIMLAQEIKNVALPPLGLFPTYCFDHDQDTLRVSYDFGSQMATRNRVGTFQERKVAVDQTISLGSATAITAHLDTLETLPVVESDMIPPAEFKKVNLNPITVSSGLARGLLTKSVPPVYPAVSKSNHVSGSVILRARIGDDGRIHLLKVISTPDPDLAIAALVAVRQWTYKPYLLNGAPVEVDTQITVIFAFSH